MKNKLICVLVLAGALLGCNSGKAQKLPPDDARAVESLDGSVLYKAYCSSCHGTDARGGGPMAKSLKVPPPDLTRIYIRNGGTFPLKRIARIISGEEQLPSGHGTREMPVWGPFFSRVENDQDLGPCESMPWRDIWSKYKKRSRFHVHASTAAPNPRRHLSVRKPRH